jgi:hypothetical protein
VLDTPSYVSKTGHRWHPDQRADAERARASTDASYVSRAEPLPIIDWSKTLFWSVVVALAGALTAAGWLGDRWHRAGRGLGAEIV